MSDFSTLKKNRGNIINDLLAAAEKAAGGTKSYTDDRFWVPTVDKAGNGYAVIRFLPATSEDPTPWVRFWDHGFKGPTGRWYIEKSLTSIGQQDPVSDNNSKLWNSGIESDKDIVRERKRRLHYVSNIEVISDPAKPECEGKVFLYKYGKKIFDKIMDVMQPQFEDETPINPFDFWEGANFKLKIRNVEGYRNYDKSEFDKPTPLFDGDDAKLEAVYTSLYSLGEFIDPKNYKSYAELEKKMYEVLGESTSGSSGNHAAAVNETAKPSALPTQDTEEEDDIPMSFDSDAEEESADDTMAYFAKLAKGN